MSHLGLMVLYATLVGIFCAACWRRERRAQVLLFFPSVRRHGLGGAGVGLDHVLPAPGTSSARPMTEEPAGEAAPRAAAATIPLLIVAGEASGDLHGARLLEELRRLVPAVEPFGLGSDELRAAGLDAIADSSEIAVVGITEVLEILPRAWRLFRRLVAETEARQARYALLIDSPDFNLRLAAALARRGVEVIYYVSPQVWAWRRRRVRTIARLVRKMLVLFPFETEFYRRHAVEAVHVGHPLVDEIPRLPQVWDVASSSPPSTFRLALLPGSRRSEVQALLPLMLTAAERIRDALDGALEVVLVEAPRLDPAFIGSLLADSELEVERTRTERYQAVVGSHLALCASGTATLEVGLLGTPLVVCYRLSWGSYWLGRLLVKLPVYSSGQPRTRGIAGAGDDPDRRRGGSARGAAAPPGTGGASSPARWVGSAPRGSGAFRCELASGRRGRRLSHFGGGACNVTRFLWRFARRYLVWAVLSVAATGVFAVSSVLLVALFRSIQAEVLMVDDGVEILPGLGTGEEGEGESTASVGLDLDLESLVAGALESLQNALGVTEANVGIFLPILFAVVFLIRSGSNFANGYLFQIMGLGATNDLRNSLYENILRQSSRFYAEHPSGELVSRVSNDVSVVQNAISNRLLDLLPQTLTLIGLVWYLLSTNFRLALVCLVVVPAVAYPIVRFGRGMRRTSLKSQEQLADVSNLVAEAVRGHRVVKAFGMERFELGRFRAAAQRHLDLKLRTQLLSHGAGPVVESVAAVAAAAFLIYAGKAIRSGALTPSELVTFLVGLVFLYDPIRKLNKVNLVLQEALAAAQRIYEVMHLPNEVEDRPGARPIDGAPQRIHYETVHFSYEAEKTVLQGVDLTIQQGEVVAFVGSSGAGKSTMVNLLPRFFDPDEGRITFDGVDIRDVTLESLRALVGIVTQDTVLFNDSVRANIAYGRSDAALDDVRRAAVAAYADGFIEALPRGYDTVIGESGVRLSGGERQRLAIARALFKDPPILILDEATSSLDSEAEALVQKALYNLMEGRTALVIAHRLSTVQRADRILVMQGGRIVEEGRHEDLVRGGGLYERLHALQFRGGEGPAEVPA